MVGTKKDVRFKEIDFYLIQIFTQLDNFGKLIKKIMYITSGNDGIHRIGSDHYKNLAIDIRCRHLDEFLVWDLMQTLSELRFMKAPLFEWQERKDPKDKNSEWIKHSCRWGVGMDIGEIVNYFESKNPTKQCHLHAAWRRAS